MVIGQVPAYGRNVPAPAGGGGGVTTLFSDDFSSGDLTRTQNGISWIAQVFADVVDLPSIARTGTKVCRLREGAAHDFAGPTPESNIRFDGLNNLNEVYLEWFLYFPTGAESPSVGPKAKCIGNHNDKFFRLWGGGDAGYDGVPIGAPTYNNKRGASLFGMGAGPTYEDGEMGPEHCASTPGTQLLMGQVFDGGTNYPGDSSVDHAPLLIDANRGRWVRIRVRSRECSIGDVANGLLQIWFDDSLEIDDQEMRDGNIYNGLGAIGYTTGYIMGAANNDWPTGQMVYVADVTISTGGFTT